MVFDKLVQVSIARPRTVFAVALLVTVALGPALPHMVMDTNPKNTLAQDAPVRVWNREVDRTFALHEDIIVVGIVRSSGIVAESSLAKIARLTSAIQEIPGVAAGDVVSLSTATSIDVDGDSLKIGRLFETPPATPAALEAIRNSLRDTPAFQDRLISRDETVTAIYAPLLKDADGRVAMERIRALTAAAGGPERYYVSGDPVVQETFGRQMFGAMAILGPLSGMLMLGIAFLMFRRASMAFAVMGAAMLVIIWAMGFIVALGLPVHIMSSMSPVFLMAIATDSIHIFNEYTFRLREGRPRETAILEAMRVLRRPLIFTDVTTALAFAALLTSTFAPIRVFGICVAFGTLALLLVSFTVIPALLAVVKPAQPRVAAAAGSGPGRVERLLKKTTWVGAHFPRATIGVGLALLALSALGMSRIRVNNNQMKWFKEGSEIRDADALLNRSLGGTSLAYVVAEAPGDQPLKGPAALRYIEKFQDEVGRSSRVGKTFSVVDEIKNINQVIHGDDKAFYKIPDDPQLIGQYLFLLGTSGRPADVENFVDGDFRRANIWLQLKTWDVSAVRDVVTMTENYNREASSGVRFKPAGVAYLNLVWNDLVLSDMLRGFLFGLIAVLVVLAINFRSMKWAFVSYAPLLFTIALIYGFVGFIGKDFDMPICVLSCLSLGMAVDFAIHFIERFRQALRDPEVPLETDGTGVGSGDRVRAALLWTASRPGRGILRNAVLFAGTFSVMLLASLTPYITVGAFMVSMMALSSFLTLIYLPALIVLLRPWLLADRESARTVRRFESEERHAVNPSGR